MADPVAGPRVLVVDDDHTVARLVLKVVRSLGFGSASHVRTGREALESGEGVDIVLLDHQLPDANGLDVLEAIRARPNPPAVILVTAHGNESLAAAALRLGADDYLAKDDSLLEMLPQVLERVRRNREVRKALAAAEKDLVRAERLAAIGEMTVTLHHNINNPLMSASADLEMLLANPDMPLSQRQQTLRDIQTALHRIRDLVRQIGDLRDVRTKPYLPGIRMVDLEGAGPAPQTPHLGTALVQVAEEDLARVVVLLLRHAGFAVERCGTVGRAPQVRRPTWRVARARPRRHRRGRRAPARWVRPAPDPGLSRGGARGGRRRGRPRGGRGPCGGAAVRPRELHCRHGHAAARTSRRPLGLRGHSGFRRGHLAEVPHSLQSGDPLADRGVRRQRVGERTLARGEQPRRRIHDAEVRRAERDRAGRRRGRLELFEGRGERQGVTRELRARRIGQILALAAHRHRKDPRDDRRHDQGQQPEPEQEDRERVPALAALTTSRRRRSGRLAIPASSAPAHRTSARSRRPCRRAGS